MKFIILDLEATCWEQQNKARSEVIEIGAVGIHENGEILSEFSSFIRPLLNPTLSDFCKKLTHISQDRIDKSPDFPQVVDLFLKWLDNFHDDYCLCSWGFYDQKQLIQDCQLHQLDTAWLNRHISLKHQYAKLKDLKEPVGMKTALGLEKMTLFGTHHRGIDDARNISQIFLKYLGKWTW